MFLRAEGKLFKSRNKFHHHHSHKLLPADGHGSINSGAKYTCFPFQSVRYLVLFVVKAKQPICNKMTYSFSVDGAPE